MSADVKILVEALYERLLGDGLLHPFFKEVSVSRQVRSMTSAVEAILAGRQLDADALSKAHARLVERGMGSEHFDAVLAHLKRVLVDFRVDDEVQLKLVQGMMKLRAAILHG